MLSKGAKHRGTHQQIQYCVTDDGVRLAWAEIGRGQPIVRPSHWLTHLEYDLESPVWRHVVLGLAQRRRLIRFDARGNGMSQREVGEISFERWVSDLERVVDALALPPFVLFGISQSAAVAVAYAVRHPERVTHLVLYGGFARGLLLRGPRPEQEQQLAFARSLVRQGGGATRKPIASGSRLRCCRTGRRSNITGTMSCNGSAPRPMSPNGTWPPPPRSTYGTSSPR